MFFNIPQVLTRSENVVASNPLNSSFVGLSLETSGLNYFLGNSSYPNVYFINMIEQLINASQSSLTIRIGGNTQESTWFDPNLSTDLIVHRHLRAFQESVTLGPPAFENLNILSSTMPVNWIVGLNFNTSLVTNPQNTILMAQAAENALGNNLYAFEIGNEPDNFVKLKQRRPGWNMTNYTKEWTAFSQKIEHAVPGVAQHGLQAAVFGSGWRIADLLYSKTNNKTFVSRFHSQIRGISKHEYQTSNCNAAFIPTIQDLLNHTSIENSIKGAVNGVNQSDITNYALRMGEFNSVSCQGRQGVSNTFAATLWAIDYMMLMSYYNITACNLHNRNPSFYNIADGDVSGWTANPIFYAMLFVSRAFRSNNGNSVVVTDLSKDTSDVVAYALYRQNTLKSIILISMQYKTPSNQGPGQNITINLNITNGQQAPEVMYMSSLLADSALSRNGIRLANQSMDGSNDGTLQGTPMATVLKSVVSKGNIMYSFSIPALSAHLIEYRKPVVAVESSAFIAAGRLAMRDVTLWIIIILFLLCTFL